MRTTPRLRCTLVVLSFLVPPALVRAQDVSPAGASFGPLSQTLVVGAPFSADATTIVIQTKRDGTRSEWKATSRYYRDSEGRVRVEYQVPSADSQVRAAFGAANPQPPPRTLVLLMVPDPDAPRGIRLYMLDDRTRTFRYGERGVDGALFSATIQFGVPIGMTPGGAPQFTAFITADVHAPGNGVVESLGTKQFEGVPAEGLRVTDAMPVICRGCDGFPGTETDERWESSELRMVVYARHTDPGTSEIDYPSKGVDIEYRLTNIKRSDPAADLFVLPSDYTVHWGSPSDPDMSIGPDRRPGQH